MAAQIVCRLKMEDNSMAIGERIRFIRNLRGMTQKFLGLQVGFSERKPTHGPIHIMRRTPFIIQRSW